MKIAIAALVALAALGACGPKQLVITDSEIGKCLESKGYAPFNAKDGDPTVLYQHKSAESIRLTADDKLVTPLDNGDVQRLRASGCNR